MNVWTWPAVYERIANALIYFSLVKNIFTQFFHIQALD